MGSLRGLLSFHAVSTPAFQEKLAIRERAEVEALETLTPTRKSSRSAKGAATAKQLAEVLNISPKTVFKLAKAGRIPSFRVGTAVGFDARLIVDWLRKQRTGYPR